MKNTPAVVSGLVSMAIVALVSGYGLLTIRRGADTLAPAEPPRTLQVVEPEEVRAHPGYAPGDPLDRNAPVITPLDAADPASMVVAPSDEPDEILERSERFRGIPDPTLPSNTPRVFSSSNSLITPLNVRDPSALVMGPGRRDPSAPSAKPKKAKPAEQLPRSDIPPEIRARFR